MELLTHLITFLFGLGAGFTLKIAISKKTSRKTQVSLVSQKEIQAGGDVIGGNKNQGNQ